MPAAPKDAESLSYHGVISDPTGVFDTSPLHSEGVNETGDATNGSEGLGRSSSSISPFAQETRFTEQEVRDNIMMLNDTFQNQSDKVILV